jgi:hypothetical protein
MNAGASGSPIIDKNFRVVGIYWGGLATDYIFSPRASQFESSNLWGLL